MHRIVGGNRVDLIKSGDYRIGAGEIETVLLGYPDVTEAVVVGLPTPTSVSASWRSWSVPPSPQALIDFVGSRTVGAQATREVRIVDVRRATRWARCSRRSCRDASI